MTRQDLWSDLLGNWLESNGSYWKAPAWQRSGNRNVIRFYTHIMHHSNRKHLMTLIGNFLKCIHDTAKVGGVNKIGILVLFPRILGYCLSQIGIFKAKFGILLWCPFLVKWALQDLGHWDLGPTKLGYWDMGPLKLDLPGPPPPYTPLKVLNAWPGHTSQ